MMATTTTEPYGTTPLPTSYSGSPVKVWFDAEAALEVAQQPQTQQIAVFEASPSDELNGALLDVNQHFVVYAVKNGLIRVLHRHSTLRALLRGHKGQQVTDIRFFQDGDVLATAAHGKTTTNDNESTATTSSSSVIIWRVFERSPEILSEILLEIATDKFKISRIVWHPFNPNQFWMIHTNATAKTVATLVETTRITTVQHETEAHAVCDFYQDFVIMEGAVQLSASDDNGNLTDLCWSDRETRHILAVHDNGEIILWDLKKLHSNNTNGTVTPTRLVTMREEAPLSRCLFLPHENAVFGSGGRGSGGGHPRSNNNNEVTWTSCFLTASDNNQEITLWSAFSADNNKKPTKLQIFGLERPAPSYLVNVCFGPAPADASPPSCFVVMADRSAGKIFAFHCRSVWDSNSSSSNNDDDEVGGGDGASSKKNLLVGCDYVVPFQSKFPTYSWSVVAVPTTDISEEELNEQGGLIFDIKLFAYQSTVVQSLTLTSYMCLPPENTWTDATPGVRVERLFQDVHSAHVSVVSSDDDGGMDYDEEFDEEGVDLDDEDDGQQNREYNAPEASALPTPEGFGSQEDGGGGAGSTPSVVTAPSSLATNPFANWLGAIGSQTTKENGSSVIPPPALPAQPAAPAVAPAAATETADGLPPQSFLSPMDILRGKDADNVQEKAKSIPATTANSRSTTTKSATPKRGRKKSPKPKSAPPAAQGNISILKRDDGPATSTPAAPESSATSTPPSVSKTAADGDLIAKEVRLAIREEMQSSLLPSIEKSIQSSLNKSVIQPIQSSINRLSKEGIKVDTDAITSSLSNSVEEPLRAAFAESMKTVLIPALESVTGQVFVQISEHLDRQAVSGESGSSKELEAMSTQLSTMTALVAKLTNEVQSLRTSLETQQLADVPASSAESTVVDKTAMIRNEVLSLLQEGKYEAAFTKAVSSSTAEITVLCCSNADLNAILGGSTPQLSQTILLCVMQHLGTVLVSAKDPTNLPMVLEWLQEIALSLNPADPKIQGHVPNVLQQLVAAINARMGQGDPSLRRPLQRLLQVVRGMQMG